MYYTVKRVFCGNMQVVVSDICTCVTFSQIDTNDTKRHGIYTELLTIKSGIFCTVVQHLTYSLMSSLELTTNYDELWRLSYTSGRNINKFLKL